MVIETRSIMGLPQPLSRTERQEEIRLRARKNANRRWREKRIQEGRNPNIEMLGLLGEMLDEYASSIIATLDQPSRVR